MASTDAIGCVAADGNLRSLPAEVLLVTAYALRHALAGRPMFRSGWLDPE